MKVRFIRDEWYPFYVEVPHDWPGSSDETYEISEEDYATLKASQRAISEIFEKLNEQYDERKASAK
jgi:hypothetical protein